MAKELLSDATFVQLSQHQKMFGYLMVMACIFLSSRTIQDGGELITPSTINVKRFI